MLEEVLKHAVGFTSRREFEEFVATLARALGVSGKTHPVDTGPNLDRLVPKVFRSVHGIDANRCLEFVCDDYEGTLYLYKTCAVVGRPSGPCWILGYKDGKVLDLRTIARELEVVSGSSCDLLDIASEAFAQHGVPELRGYLRTNVVAKLLGGYLGYLGFSKNRGLRADVPLLPADLERDVVIEVRPLAVIRERFTQEALMDFVGRYSKEKFELENKGVELLTRALSNTHTVTDVRGSIYTFDLLNREEATGLTKFAELKTLKDLRLVVYTEKEREFGELLERGGHEYWLYLVDLAQGRIRAYRLPLTADKLRLVRTVTRDGSKYYVFRELKAPDVEYSASSI